MEEIKIEEEFQFVRMKLKCVEDREGEACSACAFGKLGTSCDFLPNFGIECNSVNRKDSKDVIFIEVEE